MNQDHMTPWELLEYLQKHSLGYFKGTQEDYDKQKLQIQHWNNAYSNAFMGNADTIRWATDMCRSISYPNTSAEAWGTLQAELNWMSLEGNACSVGAIRPTMLLSTALICYTDIYKNLNTQKICRTAMRQLRRIGVDIQWSQNGITEDHAMFQVPSKVSRRNIFGKGAVPMCRRVAPVIKNCRMALLPLDQTQVTKDDWRNVSDEVIFQLNIFAEQNKFNWRATLRMDWEELWRNL